MPIQPTARWPLVAAVLVGALALVETVNALTAARRAPKDADWSAAAADVRAAFRAGDLIAFAPAWVDPVGRAHLGDLMPIEMVARSDDDGYQRAWVLSIRGARYPGAAGATVEEERQHGTVRVTRYRLPPRVADVRTTFDFATHLADATVTQVGTEAPGPATDLADYATCYQAPEDRDDGFRCASTHVGRRTLEIDYRPRRGVLVPVDGSRQTRLEWSGVPLGPGTQIVLYAGVHDYYARKSADGPIHVALVVDGAPAFASDIHNADGWRRFVVDGARWPGAHTLRVEVSSPAPAWRNLGFAASVRTGLLPDAAPTGAGS